MALPRAASKDENRSILFTASRWEFALMATWVEIAALGRQLGGEALTDEMLILELIVDSNSLDRQNVYVMYEVMPPDMAFLRLTSAIAPLARVNVADVIRRFGDLQVGSLTHIPTYNDNGRAQDGALGLTTTFPIQLIDVSDSSRFILFIHILANAARLVSRQL